MFILNESVLSLKEKNITTCCLQVLKLLYDWPVNYYFWRFRYM